MGKKTYNSNSNIINSSNSKIKRDINQVQNNYSKKEKKEAASHNPYFHELLLSIHELTQEVKELKEQIKNNNS